MFSKLCKQLVRQPKPAHFSKRFFVRSNFRSFSYVNGGIESNMSEPESNRDQDRGSDRRYNRDHDFQDSTIYPTKHFVTAVFPFRYMGFLIGSGGEFIRSVRTESDAYINISKRGNHSTNSQVAVVEARGTSPQVSRALYRFAEVCALEEGTYDISLNLESHPKKVGAVIGSGGRTIAQIRRDYDAHISVTSPRFEDLAERTNPMFKEGHAGVYLRANVGEFEQALRAVIDTNFSKDLRTMSVEAQIPDDMFARIIGKGGYKVKRICRETGVKIGIDKDKSVAKIVGTVDAISICLEFLQHEISLGKYAKQQEAYQRQKKPAEQQAVVNGAENVGLSHHHDGLADADDSGVDLAVAAGDDNDDDAVDDYVEDTDDNVDADITEDAVNDHVDDIADDDADMVEDAVDDYVDDTADNDDADFDISGNDDTENNDEVSKEEGEK